MQTRFFLCLCAIFLLQGSKSRATTTPPSVFPSSFASSQSSELSSPDTIWGFHQDILVPKQEPDIHQSDAEKEVVLPYDDLANQITPDVFAKLRNDEKAEVEGYRTALKEWLDMARRQGKRRVGREEAVGVEMREILQRGRMSCERKDEMKV
jgi:hypothetical protein